MDKWLEATRALARKNAHKILTQIKMFIKHAKISKMQYTSRTRNIYLQMCQRIANTLILR